MQEKGEEDEKAVVFTDGVVFSSPFEIQCSLGQERTFVLMCSTTRCLFVLVPFSHGFYKMRVVVFVKQFIYPRTRAELSEWQAKAT